MTAITHETRAGGEDVRARAAIERMTDRIMTSPAPGTTRESARQFVVGVAKRNDYVRPRNTLDSGRLTKSQARHLVSDRLEVATLKQPRVQAAIGRLVRKVREAFPMLTASQAYAYTVRRFLDTFMAHPRMVTLAEDLYVRLVSLKVARTDAQAAVTDLLNPDHVSEAVDAVGTPPVSLTVDVPVVLDITP